MSILDLLLSLTQEKGGGKKRLVMHLQLNISSKLGHNCTVRVVRMDNKKLGRSTTVLQCFLS